MLLYPVAVFTAGDIIDPGLVIQIPLHGFTNTRFEAFFWRPVQLMLNFTGVDGVTLVVTGTILHEGDEVFISRYACRVFRPGLVEYGADGLDYLQIRFFVVPANVVCLTHCSDIDDLTQRAGMVFNVKPVSYLIALAVDGQWFALAGVQYHQRNQFFGELARAVVI